MPKKSKQASPTFELKKYEVLRDQPVRKTSKAHADQKGTVKKGMIVICEVGRPLVLHWGAAVLRLVCPGLALGSVGVETVRFLSPYHCNATIVAKRVLRHGKKHSDP